MEVGMGCAQSVVDADRMFSGKDITSKNLVPTMPSSPVESFSVPPDLGIELPKAIVGEGGTGANGINPQNGQEKPAHLVGQNGKLTDELTKMNGETNPNDDKTNEIADAGAQGLTNGTTASKLPINVSDAPSTQDVAANQEASPDTMSLQQEAAVFPLPSSRRESSGLMVKPGLASAPKKTMNLQIGGSPPERRRASSGLFGFLGRNKAKQVVPRQESEAVPPEDKPQEEASPPTPTMSTGLVSSVKSMFENQNLASEEVAPTPLLDDKREEKTEGAVVIPQLSIDDAILAKKKQENDALKAQLEETRGFIATLKKQLAEEKVISRQLYGSVVKLATQLRRSTMAPPGAVMVTEEDMEDLRRLDEEKSREDDELYQDEAEEADTSAEEEEVTSSLAMFAPGVLALRKCHKNLQAQKIDQPLSDLEEDQVLHAVLEAVVSNPSLWEQPAFSTLRRFVAGVAASPQVFEPETEADDLLDAVLAQPSLWKRSEFDTLRKFAAAAASNSSFFEQEERELSVTLNAIRERPSLWNNPEFSELRKFVAHVSDNLSVFKQEEDNVDAALESILSNPHLWNQSELLELRRFVTHASRDSTFRQYDFGRLQEGTHEEDRNALLFDILADPKLWNSPDLIGLRIFAAHVSRAGWVV
jgi:hypothetical protein